jgi:hypothetical protein
VVVGDRRRNCTNRFNHPRAACAIGLVLAERPTPRAAMVTCSSNTRQFGIAAPLARWQSIPGHNNPKAEGAR